MAIYGNLIKDDIIEEGTYLAIVDESFKQELFKNWNTSNEKHKREVFKSDNLSEDDYQMLVETYNTLRQCESYNEYKKAFSKLCNFCHINTKGTIITKCTITSGSKKDKNSIFVEYSYNTKKIKLPEGTKLYHMSKVKGIKELMPFFRGKSAKGFLYSSPRIYLTVKKSMPKFIADYKINEKMHKYEVKDTITDVYVDPLAWGKSFGAVYVETNKPLKVEEMGIPKKDNSTNESVSFEDGSVQPTLESGFGTQVLKKAGMATAAAVGSAAGKYVVKKATQSIDKKTKGTNISKEDRDLNKRETALKRRERAIELDKREREAAKKEAEIEKRKEAEQKKKEQEEKKKEQEQNKK